MTGEGRISKAGFDRLRAVMADHVERGELPGLVMLVSRHGEVHADAIGRLAFEGSSMSRDSLFRITSMTKPVTAAAAMVLVEDGKIGLDDAVDRWLPELANRKVLLRADMMVHQTVPARRAISLRDLLTFRCGYGIIPVFPERLPIQRAYAEAGLAPGPVFPSFPPDELMRRYGSLPLIYQPGERWLYNAGSEILGVLIARLTGKTFGEFLSERIFAPLGMKDTAFYAPKDKHHRFTTAYMYDSAARQLKVFDPPVTGRFSNPPVFENGAAGLVSTADDFNAFAQMMLGGGSLGGTRVLSEESVALMTTNHIVADEKRESQLFLGRSRGWGFGLSVFTGLDDPNARPGRFGWDGGYGTSWYSAPKTQLTGILLTQRVMDSPTPPAVFTDFWTTLDEIAAK
ncbi:MAG TPA: serine hydrolase domain-containing protein [Bradyrhizobium sp.]|uniref:serine hydrolase domain-containing protein n=1 Tax=Bradyrhizobium sp. TaxID=376 RepID=UPI002D7FF3BC|nr:serine hydrolase domain-containing protein [Bradyrhizobium sp.]HET7885487.1 serine hydrolase domain-containing protein [Bradyrhizobium sp.]